jgi:hypothetical protein
MSIKYTASYNGQTFTRRSKRAAERPYTHCIIARKSQNYYEPFDLSREIDSIEYAISGDWKKYYPDNSDSTYLSVENARYTKLANTPIDEYLQECLNHRLSYYSELDFDKYYVIAWAGRPDLAAKKVDEIRGFREYTDVLAIPAE